MHRGAYSDGDTGLYAEIGVMVAIGGECKYTGGAKWGHLLHGSHTAHIPLTDVLVEG